MLWQIFDETPTMTVQLLIFIQAVNLSPPTPLCVLCKVSNCDSMMNEDNLKNCRVLLLQNSASIMLWC